MFLTTLSVLVYEISLTRAFSVLLRYHFVFLVISVAVCGLGLGGLLDYLLRRHWPLWSRSLSAMGVPLLLLALLYPGVVLLLFGTQLSLYLTSLWVLAAVCLPPFTCAGVFVSHLFARHSAASGYLYFADLVGAALGSLSVIAILQLVGGVNAALACGLMAAAAAAVVFIWARSRGGATASLLLFIALGGLLQQNLTRRLVDLPYLSPTAGYVANPLYQDLGTGNPRPQLLYSDWNAFARTDVVRYPDEQGRFDPHSDLLVFTDGEVPTNMLHFQGDLQAQAQTLTRFLGMYPFRAFQPKRVMLIGPGGGLDVLLALSVGAEYIEGAELNPSIPYLVRKFRDFCGPVYDYQNVNIQVDEGRSYLSRSRQRYDLIYMALTKTATTTSSSMALTEGYAQTTEAFEAYFDRLTEAGALAFICQEPPLLLRTLMTAWTAVQNQTGADPQTAARHLAIVDWSPSAEALAPYRHLLIMTRRPLTPERSAELAKLAIACGQEPVFFPGAYEQSPFAELTRRPLTTRQFVESINRSRPRKMPLNLLPCPDDQPFVLDLNFRPPAQFWALAAVTGGLVVVLSLLAWPGIRRRREVSGQAFAGQVVYFSLLGAGFMLLEVSLIQKLILYLGYPVLSLSVILFALLLGGSLGSLYSQRGETAAAGRRIPRAGLGVLITGLVVYAVAAPLMKATLFLDIQTRSLITMLLVLPLAWFLGMLLPSGLRLMSVQNPRGVPWMWGVNGLSSVSGSVLAMLLAKLWGFSWVFLTGLGLYLLVIVLAGSGSAFRVGRDGPEATPARPEPEVVET
ncbi:MAG: hypothetical protein GX100_09210 [candidate division WS1 bacterium]|nr:hypothetical protein [candidate division WS1 bacterium]